MEENRALTLGTDTEVEVASMKKQERVNKIKGIFGVTALGLALVAAIAYLPKSQNATTSLRHSNAGEALELTEDTSTFYLVKHSFKDPADADGWWKNFTALASDADKFKAVTGAWAEAGYWNSYFLPTGKEGPFYCLWEVLGKTEDEFLEFINGPTSPAHIMDNEPMKQDAADVGGMPPVPSFFAAKAASERRLDDVVARRLEDARRLTSPNTYYLVKHEFKSSDDVDPWWEKLHALVGDKEKMMGWVKAVAADGFHSDWMFPTAKDGPIYCLWEAKAGKTKEDLQEYIDTNKKSPAYILKNTVMPLMLSTPAGFDAEGKPNTYFDFE